MLNNNYLIHFRMNINAAFKTEVLEIIQRLAYSMSVEDYDRYYGELKALNLDTLNKYYDNNWHHIRPQWVEGLKHKQMSLGIRTNNRLESQFQKLKSMTSHCHNLSTFLETFFAYLGAMRTNRDTDVARIFTKVPSCPKWKDDITIQYEKLLTPYAFERVEKQLQLVQLVTIIDVVC